MSSAVFASLDLPEPPSPNLGRRSPMTEAIIYATVIVTAATLAYWWPAIRRKHLEWKRRRLARKAFRLLAANARAVADLTRAMRQASRDIDRASRILGEVEVHPDDR